MAESAGVKVTGWADVPSEGAVAGELKAKFPGTEARPPLREEFARVWPSLIEEAEGAVETVVGALFTVTFTVLVAFR